ncbi:FtsK/SpoIIIE domain-containing protein [Paenarthrobacter sp. 2TAF44]|uniref:FtsK/SpoIIIE domain-containing protein n=1 Tax=Paenarthrobacter sp. 2TAF44 TaxID=3233018 RepID=UPI003F962722
MQQVIRIVDAGVRKSEIEQRLQEALNISADEARSLSSGQYVWCGGLTPSLEEFISELRGLASKVIVGRRSNIPEDSSAVVALSQLGDYILEDLWAKYAAEVEVSAIASVRKLNDSIGVRWVSPQQEIDVQVDEYRALEQQLREARRRLLDSLKPRGITVDDLRGGSPGPAISPLEWMLQADEVADRADAKRIPFFQIKRLEDIKEFTQAGRSVLAPFESVVEKLQKKRDAKLDEINKRAFKMWMDRSKRDLTDGTLGLDSFALSLGPGPLQGKPRWLGGAVSAGDIDSPRVYVGENTLSAHTFTASHVAADSSKSASTQTIAIEHNPALFHYPVVVDLDAAGGFVTDQRNAIESSVLQLLDTVDAGMLRIDGVDPVGLGKSLDFLYGLNDAGDHILGDAIWTTSDQVSKLLIEIEKHVTFVTQKYLQGQHSSLTEYNIAAGEVAEPYRVVLLYDFPKMFTRDGRSFDQEALSRLQRLASVGRRAGVFFFVETPAHERTQSALAGLPNLYATSAFDAPLHVPDSLFLKDIKLTWRLTFPAEPTSTVREEICAKVLRGLASQTEARVLPETVVEIAMRRDALSAQRGLGVSEGIAMPNDPGTWWAASSANGVESRFGRMGSSGVANLIFNSKMESSALIGGQTGSGKSSLFHALILDLVLNYDPSELELYLVDLKEGVEFKQYAESKLPHARAVAIESSREFAVSVLLELEAEIQRRGAKFKAQGGSVVDVTGYRRATGQPMPRIVLMIDEFHKLLMQEDAVRREGERLLERVIKEGRAFGIHVVLGSQTIALVGSAFRSLADQIFYRLVLSSSEADSRLLLGEGNPDAQLLTRPGEGILNTKNGLREGNDRFQASYWDPKRRHEVLEDLRSRANKGGWVKREPIVFEGSEPQSIESLDAQLLGRSDPHKELAVMVGAPMSLEGPFSVTLDRSPGRSLLVVDDQGLHTLMAIAVDLAAAGVTTTFVDFGVFDAASEPLKDAMSPAVSLVSPRGLPGTMSQLTELLEQRIQRSDYAAPAHVVMLAGIQRARELASDLYTLSDSSSATQLQRILTEGPEFGVHVIALADRPASVDRRLTSAMIREFGIKIVGTMGADDSRRLVDSDCGARLKASEVYFDDYDRVINKTLRRFEVKNPEWISAAVERDSVNG